MADQVLEQTECNPVVTLPTTLNAFGTAARYRRVRPNLWAPPHMTRMVQSARAATQEEARP